ncbi:MAG: trimeric autotransporter adhesin [Solirubrobacteraceae bacterium]|nr:trimeric autotransporter adhesin [Solirubrobacteraceae bacterium]
MHRSSGTTRAMLGLIAALSLTAALPNGAAAQDKPQVDVDYVANQLVSMSSSYLMRYSGFDGPLGGAATDGNLPPQVNGWNEFFDHWRQQMRDPAVLGSFASAGHIDDHPFPVAVFTGSITAPNPGDDMVLTIPGASCPGQTTLIAGHPDSTPGLNTGNGSTYDDTSGITMGMGETQALARWWQANGTWPARTFKVGMFDAEEVGLDGSYWYAAHLLPPGPQGKYVMVANMDQNGLEYPAHPQGLASSTWTPGAWYTNINASPIKDFSLSDYGDGKGGPNPAIAANLPAIEQFRSDLAAAVSEAFVDQGAKYGHSVPLLNGSAPAYSLGDIATKSPVQDDTLGRTDQVPFVAKGIPGFGVLGAYDSNPQEDITGGLPLPLHPPVSQQAGYDTPRDNVAHFNLMTSGLPTPDAIDQAAKQALELPATWTSYLLARPQYAGAAPAPSAPIAYFEALPNDAKPGDPIAFNAAASTDPAAGGLTYTWDFGDGTAGSGVAPTHRFGAAGWYDVRMVVQDAAGHAVGYRQAVRVGDPASLAPATDPCGNVSSSEVAGILGAPQPASGPVVAAAAVRGQTFTYRLGRDAGAVRVDLLRGGSVRTLARAQAGHAGVPYHVRTTGHGAGMVRLTVRAAGRTVRVTRTLR